jgi:hypothetical protein
VCLFFFIMLRQWIVYYVFKLWIVSFYIFNIFLNIFKLYNVLKNIFCYYEKKKKKDSKPKAEKKNPTHNYNHFTIISVWAAIQNEGPHNMDRSLPIIIKTKRNESPDKIRCANDCCCEDCLLKTTHCVPIKFGPPNTLHYPPWLVLSPPPSSSSSTSSLSLVTLICLTTTHSSSLLRSHFTHVTFIPCHYVLT